MRVCCFFSLFFKQKTAYEMRISHWSSDVCSSDLRGVEQRRRRLQAEPLCRDCKAKGVITAATAPDHIVPLALGGSDDDSNVRCLCPECHLERTREQFGHRARSTIGEDGWHL